MGAFPNGYRRHGSQANSDDLFAGTRMPFGDHLEELRWRLWRAVAGFAAVVFLVFTLDFIGFATGSSIGVAKPLKDFIAYPVEQELTAFYRRRVEKVLAGLDHEEGLLRANRPTGFVRMGFYRRQILALLRGQPAAVVNRFARPQLKGEAAGPALHDTIEINEGDVLSLWVRQEEPLRDAAYRQEAERQVGRRPTLATMSLMEGMMVYLQVALACGIVLGSPWIVGQIWAFVASGLYPHEKRPIYVYIPVSIGLFVLGVLGCQLWVIPKAIATLLGFNEWLDLEPDLRLKEWLGFAVWMPLVFGLSFQTPLVMLVLERVGLLSLASYQRKRRLAWFSLAAVAAIATPPLDVLSMLVLWGALGLLFESGILLCRWVPKDGSLQTVDGTISP
jgi:sec-independent protein translocase protein TatC